MDKIKKWNHKQSRSEIRIKDVDAKREAKVKKLIRLLGGSDGESVA